MSFVDNIKNSFKILIFDEQALSIVANDEGATNYGVITLVLAAIALSLGFLNIFMLFSFAVGFAVMFGFYHLLAKLLGGQASGSQYFRALSNSFVLYWLTVIPVIGVFVNMVATLWMTVLNIYILHKVHQLSILKAIILGLLPVGLIFVLMVVGGLALFGVLAPTAMMPFRG